MDNYKKIRERARKARNYTVLYWQGTELCHMIPRTKFMLARYIQRINTRELFSTEKRLTIVTTFWTKTQTHIFISQWSDNMILNEQFRMFRQATWKRLGMLHHTWKELYLKVARLHELKVTPLHVLMNNFEKN